MDSFFSTVKLELGEHFESNRDAKDKVFDYIEVFYNQEPEALVTRLRYASRVRTSRNQTAGGAGNLSTEADM